MVMDMDKTFVDQYMIGIMDHVVKCGIAKGYTFNKFECDPTFPKTISFDIVMISGNHASLIVAHIGHHYQARLYDFNMSEKPVFTYNFSEYFDHNSLEIRNKMRLSLISELIYMSGFNCETIEIVR